MHIGVLFPSLMGQVARSYVVLRDRAVSQHVSEMMHELTAIICVIPTACLWEERICNQWAHQGSKPNEKVKSLQKCGKQRPETWLAAFLLNEWLITSLLNLLCTKLLLTCYVSGERQIKHSWCSQNYILYNVWNVNAIISVLLQIRHRYYKLFHL